MSFEEVGMSDTTAPKPVVAEGAPRFSWPMRLFLFVLLFDIIFRSLSVLIPWREWADELDMAVLPWRLPTRAEITELRQQEPTASNPMPVSNRVLESLDDVWTYLKPWPSASTRTKIDSSAGAMTFATCWLCSRLEFAENLFGTNQEWPMFSPNVSKRRTWRVQTPLRGRRTNRPPS